MNIEESIIEFKKMIERDKDTLRYWKSDTFGHYDEPIKKLEKDVLISETLLTAYEKEKEKNKKAYIKANNYLYFNDSADYEVALWEVIRKLRPDLAEKWDNGEDVDLEYIEEE